MFFFIVFGLKLNNNNNRCKFSSRNLKITQELKTLNYICIKFLINKLL